MPLRYIQSQIMLWKLWFTAKKTKLTVCQISSQLDNCFHFFGFQNIEKFLPLVAVQDLHDRHNDQLFQLLPGESVLSMVDPVGQSEVT